VRGGIVPVRVALAEADQTAVPHIHRDQHALALFRRNGSLAQNHGFQVDIVVDCRKAVCHLEIHVLYDLLCDGAAVELRVTLQNRHIVQIVVKQGAFGKSEAFVEFYLLRAAFESVRGRFLIMLRRLFAHVAAAGMDHQIELSLFVFSNFDEMVAAPEGSQAERGALYVHVFGAPELF